MSCLFTSLKVKESPLKRTPNSTLSLERSQTSSRASPISSTTPSPRPGSGRAATPQQLAAALKRLSVKQSPQGGAAGGGGEDKRALSPEPRERKGLKDLGKGSGYEDRRKSLNSMESRLQALRSSQVGLVLCLLGGFLYSTCVCHAVPSWCSNVWTWTM